MKLLQKRIISALLVSTFVLTGPASMSSNAQGKRSKEYKNDKNYEQMENIKYEKENIDKIKIEIKFEKEKAEKKIKKAKEDKDDKLTNELLNEIEELQKNIDKLNKNMKDLKRQMKKIAKEKYTQEELEKLENIAKQIKESNKNISVLPVENIISEDLNMKFDTPPVIKYGRTLIPVRAISEGLGADVKWNAEDKKVIITKDDVEIILSLEDGKAYVNGEEKEIDVPAEIMSNRTIVPLRFIAENLGLDVDYDKETETIELEESTEDEEDGVTTEDEIDEESIEDETDEEDKIATEGSTEDKTDEEDEIATESETNNNDGA
ncbi:stalk domain-containing protein [Tepidibacter hydrothermalis]|uniref:Stalk domain-containing protein n=1 Tax=Tepidibacter hydrothermalis TaxID=3036126 RepID=A0ABY8EHM9_9FIRM|nr:stalk domain-containing protein [Tepidibacter hydrothermalis]WFD10335.1 stalk domain-containing protein [Tepidibacter hydrothermalis]